MTQRIAIIDLGSNTTRLVVYEYEPGHRFRLTDELREVVRLREGMGNGMVLRAAAVDRATQAMRMFASFCRSQGVDDVIMTATSAVRDAQNGASFLARIRAETGWEPLLLSGEQEGAYGALGAVNATGLQEGYVIDLGGGSAQIVEIRGGIPGRAVSLPLGALRLSELFLGFDEAKPSSVARLNDFLQEHLGPVDWFKVQPGDCLVALGGTVRNLARIEQASSGFPLDMVNGYELAADRVQEMAGRFWRMSLRERGKLSGLDPDRADIIQSGALAYAAMLAHSGFASITISQQGLREGIFYERFLAGQPHPVFDNLREFSVLNLARNFEYNAVHSEHVTRLSLCLFDQMQPTHRLGPVYRELLWAAGILHDIGNRIDYYYHHHHSAYIVGSSGLPGYTPREVGFVALLTRYHRKGSPKAGELAPLLSDEDQTALPILSGMLRLAEFLERGRSQVVRDVRCHLDLANGWLQIEALAAGDASMEIWDASRNADVLSRALGLDVELVAGVWLENVP